MEIFSTSYMNELFSTKKYDGRSNTSLPPTWLIFLPWLLAMDGCGGFKLTKNGNRVELRLHSIKAHVSLQYPPYISMTSFFEWRMLCLQKCVEGFSTMLNSNLSSVKKWVWISLCVLACSAAQTLNGWGFATMQGFYFNIIYP